MLIYRPLAPRSWAYTGRRGTTIPTPVIDVKMEKKIVANIFLSDEFIWKGKGSGNKAFYSALGG
jgi:hypothetical protein